MTYEIDGIDFSQVELSKDSVMDYYDAQKTSKRYPIIYYHYFQKGWFTGQVPLGNRLIFKPIPSFKYFETKMHIGFKYPQYAAVAEQEELIPFINCWRIKIPVNPEKLKSPLTLIDAEYIILHYTEIPNDIQIEGKTVSELFKEIANLVYSTTKYSYLKPFMPKLVTYMPIMLIGKGNNENIVINEAKNLAKTLTTDIINENVYILRLTSAQQKAFAKFHYTENYERIDYTYPLEPACIMLANVDEFKAVEVEITLSAQEYIVTLIKHRYNFFNYIKQILERDRKDIEKWNKVINVFEYLLKL